MSRYTKAERHEIYKAAKKEIQNNRTEWGIFQTVRTALAITTNDPWITYCHFPEFKEHLNLNSRVTWSSPDEEGYKKRIEVLDDCIEKTKP